MKTLNERQLKILDLINEFHYLTIKQLVEKFEVSEMTIRRDISFLADKNLVNQVNGGVISLNYRDPEKRYSLSQELTKNIFKKKAIAKKALSLLSDEDVIFLDSGTTVQALAEIIPNDSHFTVITASFNSLEVLTKFSNCTVISPGGVYAPKQNVFYSSDASNFFIKHRTNKCFIGATGFDLELGLTCSYMEDVATKQYVIESSQEKILLLDSTKYNKVGPFVFAGIEIFSTVITDEEIPTDYKNKIIDLGINLIIAKSDTREK